MGSELSDCFGRSVACSRLLATGRQLVQWSKRQSSDVLGSHWDVVVSLQRLLYLHDHQRVNADVSQSEVWIDWKRVLNTCQRRTQHIRIAAMVRHNKSLAVNFCMSAPASRTCLLDSSSTCCLQWNKCLVVWIATYIIIFICNNVEKYEALTICQSLPWPSLDL